MSSRPESTQDERLPRPAAGRDTCYSRVQVAEGQSLMFTVLSSGSKAAAKKIPKLGSFAVPKDETDPTRDALNYNTAIALVRNGKAIHPLLHKFNCR